MRRLRDDRGEAGVGLSVAGALISSGPFLLAVSGQAIESGVFKIAAWVAAVTAIGVGAHKVWTLNKRLVSGVEDIVSAGPRLDYLEKCMELVLDHLGIEPPDKDEEK